MVCSNRVQQEAEGLIKYAEIKKDKGLTKPKAAFVNPKIFNNHDLLQSTLSLIFASHKMNQNARVLLLNLNNSTKSSPNFPCINQSCMILSRSLQEKESVTMRKKGSSKGFTVWTLKETTTWLHESTTKQEDIFIANVKIEVDKNESTQ